jgi:putative NADH-flavin reductase
MHVFIVGATGKTGTALVTQALNRGHKVTAFGRSAYVGPRHDLLSVVNGNPLVPADLAPALLDHDAVLSALGTRGLGQTAVLQQGARALGEAMPRAAVKRLIVISSTLTAPRTFGARLAARTLLRHHARDQRVMETLIAATTLDWTIVRAPPLTQGPATGGVALSDQCPPTSAPGRISRRDLAGLMLDAAEDRSYVKQMVTVCRSQP